MIASGVEERGSYRWIVRVAVCAVLAGLGFEFIAHWTPTISERIYYLWPPMYLVCHEVCGRYSRVMSTGQQVQWALLGFAAMGIISLDYGGAVNALQPGEMTRGAYCLWGVALGIQAMRKSLRRLLPAAIFQKIHYRLPCAIVWIVVLAGILQPYLLSYMQVHPFKLREQETPLSEYGIFFERVEFVSHDGIPLRGWFVPAEGSDCAVIVCHGAMDTKSGMLDIVNELHRDGLNVLAMDMRGHGESGGWTVTYGPKEADDVVAAIDYLKRSRTNASQKILGVGWSMGAATLILAAGQDDRLAGLHLESPYASVPEMAWKMAKPFPGWYRGWSYYAGMVLASLESGVNLFDVSPLAVVSQVSPRPLLIVHGDSDEVIPVEQGRRVYEAAGEPKIYVEVPRARHISCWPAEGDEYAKRMRMFLNEARSLAP